QGAPVSAAAQIPSPGRSSGAFETLFTANVAAPAPQGARRKRPTVTAAADETIRFTPAGVGTKRDARACTRVSMMFPPGRDGRMRGPPEWILSPAASTAMCSTTRIRRRTTAFFRCGTVPPMTGESRDLDLRTRAPARVGDLRGAVFGSRQALRFELQ